MAYVYLHLKKDTNEVFYVGIGRDETSFRRAYRTDGRSAFWQKVVKKYGYTVVIYLSGLSWGQACTEEKKLIAFYKKRKDGGTLVNLTDGGDGVVGVQRIPWNKGKKGLQTSWNKGKKMDAAFKEACSIRQKKTIANNGHPMHGEKHSVESRMKMQQARIGAKHSDETKEAISKTRKRNQLGMFIDGNLIKKFSSIHEASKQTGLSAGSISLIVNGHRKTPRRLGYELKKI